MTQLPRARSTDVRHEGQVLRWALVLFIILHPAALLGVLWAASTASAGTLHGATPIAWIAGVIGCTIFASWRNWRHSSPMISAIGFVASEGLLLGGFVAFWEGVIPGLALQLSFAAFSAAIAALAVLSTRRVRALPRAVRLWAVTAAAALALCLHNVGFANIEGLPLDSVWGYGSPLVLGVPLGLMVGAVMIVLASRALVLRVEKIHNSAGRGATPSAVPREALGTVTTILWPSSGAPRPDRPSARAEAVVAGRPHADMAGGPRSAVRRVRRGTSPLSINRRHEEHCEPIAPEAGVARVQKSVVY